MRNRCAEKHQRHPTLVAKVDLVEIAAVAGRQGERSRGKNVQRGFIRPRLERNEHTADITKLGPLLKIDHGVEHELAQRFRIGRRQAPPDQLGFTPIGRQQEMGIERRRRRQQRPRVNVTPKCCDHVARSNDLTSVCMVFRLCRSVDGIPAKIKRVQLFGAENAPIHVPHRKTQLNGQDEVAVTGRHIAVRCKEFTYEERRLHGMVTGIAPPDREQRREGVTRKRRDKAPTAVDLGHDRTEDVVEHVREHLSAVLGVLHQRLRQRRETGNVHEQRRSPEMPAHSPGGLLVQDDLRDKPARTHDWRKACRTGGCLVGVDSALMPPLYFKSAA